MSLTSEKVKAFEEGMLLPAHLVLAHDLGREGERAVGARLTDLDAVDHRMIERVEAHDLGLRQIFLPRDVRASRQDAQGYASTARGRRTALRARPAVFRRSCESDARSYNPGIEKPEVFRSLISSRS